MARDLSTSGAFLTFADSLEPDQDVALRIRLPGGELRLPGRVASKRGRGEAGDEGIGIQFDPLEDAAIAAIQRFVEGRIDAFRL